MTSPRGTSVPEAALALEPRWSFAQRWLALGVVAAGFAVLLHHGVSQPDMAIAPTAAPTSSIKVAALKPVPVVRQAPPSVFDREAAMDNAQLIARWDPLINQASKRFGVPPDWIKAVMRQESGGRTMLDENTRMISTAGAMGVMQVLPETYADMRADYHLGADPYDPHDNIFAGTAYLKFLHGKYGYPAMFAAYNDGPGDLEAFQRGARTLPDETRNYVQSIGRMLKDPTVAMPGGALPSPKPAVLTRPDGSQISVDVTLVTAVRAPVPDEYAPSVHAVISLGRLRQGVREDVAAATTLLRQHGARL